MTSIEQLKKKYESGDWVCYVTDRYDSPWGKFESYKKPELFVFDSEILIWKLIHKNHSHIADALIENSSIEVEWINYSSKDTWLTLGTESFFDFYEHKNYLDYRLKESKQDFNGGYTIASEESYKLLTESGYRPRAQCLEYQYLIVTDTWFTGCSHTKEKEEFKQFYINNGQLSWDKPEGDDKDDGQHTNTTNEDALVAIDSYSEYNTSYTLPENNGFSTSTDDTLDILSITDSEGNEYSFEKPSFECELLKVKHNAIFGIAYNGEITTARKWSLNGNALNGEMGAYSLTPIKKPWYETCTYPCLVTNGNGMFRVLLDKDLLDSIDKPATKEELLSLYVEEK